MNTYWTEEPSIYLIINASFKMPKCDHQIWYIRLLKIIYLYASLRVFILCIMFCPHNIISFDHKAKQLNVIMLRHIGRYKVTTDIYMHFMQVVNYTVFTSNLFALQDIRIEFFYHVNISNCTKMHIFAQFWPLNNRCFFLLENELYIILYHTIWAIKAWTKKHICTHFWIVLIV